MSFQLNLTWVEVYHTILGTGPAFGASAAAAKREGQMRMFHSENTIQSPTQTSWKRLRDGCRSRVTEPLLV